MGINAEDNAVCSALDGEVVGEGVGNDAKLVGDNVAGPALDVEVVGKYVGEDVGNDGKVGSSVEDSVGDFVGYHVIGCINSSGIESKCVRLNSYCIESSSSRMELSKENV